LRDVDHASGKGVGNDESTSFRGQRDCGIDAEKVLVRGERRSLSPVRRELLCPTSFSAPAVGARPQVTTEGRERLFVEMPVGAYAGDVCRRLPTGEEDVAGVVLPRDVGIWNKVEIAEIIAIDAGTERWVDGRAVLARDDDERMNHPLSPRCS